MKTYRHFARLRNQAFDLPIVLDIESKTYQDGTETHSRIVQSIATDVPGDRPDWAVEATRAANEMLTAQDWDPLGEWRLDGGDGFVVEVSAGARADLARLAARQIRRGVDAMGMFMADIPRCNEIGPDGSTTCNLASTHRALDPSDRHEYFTPIPGGRTLMSWAHCQTPSCCHYAATGEYCTGHARQAGLHASHTG